MNEKPIRIAVLGGTFDPPHFGHLAAAEAAGYELEAEKVILIPAGEPPHKPGCLVTGPEHRLAMARLASEGNPFFEVSDMETARPGLSFTVDTIRELKNIYPGTEIIFIIGADTIEKLESWRGFGELARLCSFAAVSRPGTGDAEAAAEIARLGREYGARIRLVPSPGVDVSSSEIRRLVSLRKPIKYLLPEAVEKYIRYMGLYAREFDAEGFLKGKYPEILKDLRENLSPKRFNHTLGVVETALKLAKRHGIDDEKAVLAALLHDCAKKPGRGVIHAAEGAERAAEKYGVTDTDALNAIRWHTTGRAGMSALEKLIYVADCAEPFREFGNGDIIEAAMDSLDRAMLACLEVKIGYTRQNGKEVDKLSYEAYNDIQNNLNDSEEKNG